MRTEGSGRDADFDAKIVVSGKKLLSYWEKLGFRKKNVADAPDTLFLHTIVMEFDTEYVGKHPLIKPMPAAIWPNLHMTKDQFRMRL